jgi:hypothetical protein
MAVFSQTITTLEEIRQRSVIVVRICVLCFFQHGHRIGIDGCLLPNYHYTLRIIKNGCLFYMIASRWRPSFLGESMRAACWNFGTKRWNEKTSAPSVGTKAQLSSRVRYTISQDNLWETLTCCLHLILTCCWCTPSNTSVLRWEDSNTRMEVGTELNQENMISKTEKITSSIYSMSRYSAC